MSFVLSVSLLAALVFNVAAYALAAVPQPYQPGDFAPTFTVNALGNYTSPYVYSQDSGPLNGKNVVALRIDEVDLFVMNFFNCNVSRLFSAVPLSHCHFIGLVIDTGRS